MFDENKNMVSVCNDCNLEKTSIPKTKDKRYFIKVNLPSSEESYASGNGEGCWCIADLKTNEAYNNDEDKGNYEVILDNDSFYYPGLMAGTTVPIEMRGKNRPVVPINWLIENYGESNWGKE